MFSNFLGQYLAAAAVGGFLFASGDFGASWDIVGPSESKNWYSITSSSSGQYIYAVGKGISFPIDEINWLMTLNNNSE